MRQRHRAGETLFVDSAGQTISVVHPLTGAVHAAALCIAVLGASNSPCAEATWRQSLPEWIGSHLRAFEALDGVPQVLVPDNLKAAVTRAHRYDPPRNRTYEALAQHSGVAIVPARAATPRDKAKVAVGVHVVERWMLARLRHATFFSLPAVHPAITALLGDLKTRLCKKLPGASASLFAAIDRPALPPLPAQPSADAEWTRVRVHIDSPVEIAGHDSSVPYRVVRQPLAARLSAQVVAIFHKGPGVRATSALRTRAATARERSTGPRPTGTMPRGPHSG